MSGKRCKYLKRKITPYPHKVLVNELSKIFGEEKVLNGNINIWKQTKNLWKSKNNKERKLWKQVLV